MQLFLDLFQRWLPNRVVDSSFGPKTDHIFVQMSRVIAYLRKCVMFWEVGSNVDCKTSQLVGLLMADVLEGERKLKG